MVRVLVLRFRGDNFAANRWGEPLRLYHGVPPS